MKVRRYSQGFTLIELMITVALIGILSSIAIPEFSRFSLRTRTSERRTLMSAIVRSVSDVVSSQGKIPDGLFIGDWNPPGVTTPSPRWFSASMAGWNQLPLNVEGKTYYSYRFVADAHAAAAVPLPTLDVLANGDLDGDGVESTKAISYIGFGASLSMITETPPEGSDDRYTF